MLSLSWNSPRNRTISALKGFLQARLLGKPGWRGSTLLEYTGQNFFPCNDVFLQRPNKGIEPHTAKKPFEQFQFQGYHLRLATGLHWQRAAEQFQSSTSERQEPKRNAKATLCSTQLHTDLGTISGGAREALEAAVSCPWTASEFSQNGSVYICKTSDSIQCEYWVSKPHSKENKWHMPDVFSFTVTAIQPCSVHTASISSREVPSPFLHPRLPGSTRDGFLKGIKINHLHGCCILDLIFLASIPCCVMNLADKMKRSFHFNNFSLCRWSGQPLFPN